MRRGHAIRMLPGRWARCWGVGCGLRAATGTVSARGTSRSTTTALQVWWVSPVLSSVRCASSGGIDSRPSSDSGSVSNAPPCMDACQTLLPFERDHREPGFGDMRKYQVDFDTPNPFKTMLKAFGKLRIKPEDTPAYLKEKNLPKEAQLKDIIDNAAALMQQMAMAYRGVTYEHINARLTPSHVRVTDMLGAAEQCKKLVQLGLPDFHGDLADNQLIIAQACTNCVFQVYLYRPLPPFEESKPLGAAVEPSIGGVDRRPSSDSGSDAAKDVSRTPFPFELNLFVRGVCGEEYRVGFRTTEPFETMLKAFSDLKIKHEDTPDYLKKKNLTVEAQMKAIEVNAAALMQQMAMAYRGVTYDHINARLKRGTSSDAKVTNIAGAVEACGKLLGLGSSKLSNNESILAQVADIKVFEVFQYRPLPPVEQPKSWRELATVNGSAGVKGTARLPGLSERENVFTYRCYGKDHLVPPDDLPWVSMYIKPNTLQIKDFGTQLHVFSGESGSGKTVTSIASALESMNSYEVVLNTRVCIVVSGMRDGYLGINNTTPRDTRNDYVAEYLKRLCERIVQHLNVATLQRSDSVGVTLLFDECGDARNFIRSLCALYGRDRAASNVLSELPKKLRCTRVFLMAAGTGSELVLEQIGSLPTSFAISRVDCDRALIGKVHASLIQHVRDKAKTNEDNAPVFAANLESLATFLESAVACVNNEDAVKEPQPQGDANKKERQLPHPAAQHIGRLMRNLRVAALFVFSCINCSRHIAEVVTVDWREVAPEFMRSALANFRRANGLSSLTGTKLQGILLDALGYALGGPNQSLEGTEALIKYGLLTDNAVLVSSDGTKAAGEGEKVGEAHDKAGLVISTWSQKVDEKPDIEYSIVLPKAYSTRFRMSIAVAEMALRGFGSVARSSDSLGFEDTVRDYLMMHMMGACSRVAEISVGMTEAQIEDAKGQSSTKELYNCPEGTNLSCTGDPFRDLKCEIHQRVRAACRAAVEHLGPYTPLTVHFASLELSTPPEGVKVANKTRWTPSRVVATLLRELNRRPNASCLDSLVKNPVLLLCAVKSYPRASAADVFAVSALIERDDKGDWRQVELHVDIDEGGAKRNSQAIANRRNEKNSLGEPIPKSKKPCVATNVQLSVQCKYSVQAKDGFDYDKIPEEFDKMPESTESKSYLLVITNRRTVKSGNTVKLESNPDKKEKEEEQQEKEEGQQEKEEGQRSLSIEEMISRTLAVRKDAAEKWFAPVPIVLLSDNRNPWSHASELSYSPVSVKGWKVADPKPAEPTVNRTTPAVNLTPPKHAKLPLRRPSK